MRGAERATGMRAHADRRLRRAAAWIAVAAFLAASADAAPLTRRVLFVGNSLTYFHDMPAIVEALSVAAGNAPVRLECRAVTAPGFSLEDHWDGSDARAQIARGGWSFVVLQQGSSALAASRESLLQDARRFAPLIRQAGATPALYAVWPSAARRFDFDAVAVSYAQAAKDVGGVLLPVGTAWQAAWRRDPGLALYEPDGLHPSLAGSYLAALVIYERLSGQSAAGLPASLTLEGGARMELPVPQARLLQEAAAEANRTLDAQKTRVNAAPR
jgi:hypothetical protein